MLSISNVYKIDKHHQPINNKELSDDVLLTPQTVVIIIHMYLTDACI